MYVGDHLQIEYARQQETSLIKRRASRAGLVLWMFLLAQAALLVAAVFISLLDPFSFSEWMLSLTPLASTALNMIEYVLLLGVPLIIGLRICRKDGIVPVVAEPVPPIRAVAYLLAGLGVCVFANFIASWAVEFWELFGIRSPAMEMEQDGSAATLLMMLLSTAVLPAFMEELLFRGVILQALRPAGDVSALVLSSVLFGLTHGTIAQIPFATLIGLVCGYLVLKTGNLYLGMILHFLNNALAVFLDFLTQGLSDERAGVWFYLVFAVLAMLGLVGWLYLRHRAPDAITPVNDGVSSWLSRAQRRRCVWLSPLILIYMIAMLLLTFLSAGVFASIEEWMTVPGGFPYG
ncbi:MAG: CPBP family intramembrane metalloprotease [Clostridia bacterium]|nr:CPBP family intramembrane metalloprotease [Clostridia bacterium]